jgi:hypothetical protein
MGDLCEGKANRQARRSFRARRSPTLLGAPFKI